MRKGEQQLSRQEAIAILETGQTSVQALSDDEGYPYAVPMNYVYLDGMISFHNVTIGHKMMQSNAILVCPSASSTS